MRFASSSELTSHRRQHTGEKPCFAVMVVVIDVRDTGEKRKLSAVFVQVAQVAGAFVFQPGRLGEQKGRMQPEVATDE